jgi:hypothetical protein
MSKQDGDELADIQKEASQEAEDRADAQDKAATQQKEAGDEPDSQDKVDEARRDADWDAAADHADSGGKFTK